MGVVRASKGILLGGKDTLCCLSMDLVNHSHLELTLMTLNKGMRILFCTCVTWKLKQSFSHIFTYIVEYLCCFCPGLANPNDAYTVYYGERCCWNLVVNCKGNTGHGSRFIESDPGSKMVCNPPHTPSPLVTPFLMVLNILILFFYYLKFFTKTVGLI